MAPDLISEILPRVLIVSRRTLRKNKFVDFVGEYHLDLIVRYGAVPVIVPRVSGVHMLLDSFEPIHGVLLCEGEDIDPATYTHQHHQPDEQENVVSSSTCCLSAEELDEIRRLHASDTAIDAEKDSIELRLAKLCLERNIPFLGICRGSQVLNVACGGTLYQDIAKQLHRDVIVIDEHHKHHRHSDDDGDGDGDHPMMAIKRRDQTTHIDYDNYDEHRHPVRLVEGTPLRGWFKDSLLEANGEGESIMVNSYHHQGVKRLAQRFVPMAFAPDGLIEGFYDPDAYNPDQGKFIMGLQFHPERMRSPHNPHSFDYPGCPSAYQEFVKAVVAYQKKLRSNTSTPACVKKLDKQMEKKRNTIIRSFSLAKNIYTAKHRQAVPFPSRESYELEAGAEFLESNTVLSVQQENRLMQMGATVRNASSYFQKQKMNGERESLARSVMGKMKVEQLTDLLSFYHMMSHICSEVLQTKIQDHIAAAD